jgi:hypothetical protein
MMKPIRYVFVILAGSIGGIIWAMALVDFTPPWYDRLAGPLQLLVLLLPALVNLCCSALFVWWGVKACLVYGLVVLAWWIPGSLLNETANAGDLSHLTLADQLCFGVIGAAVIVMGWAVGRGLRRVFKR